MDDREVADATPVARGPLELVYAWRDALKARDARRFARLFSEDGVMIDVEHRTADLATPRPLVGRQEIEATTRRWCATVGNFDYVVCDVVADGDRAAARWKYEWQAPSGYEALEGVTWLTCRDGYITLALVYFDSFAMLSAEGLAEGRAR